MSAYASPSRSVMFTADESQRVKAFIVRIGGVALARKRLAVSEHTLDAAREQGRMLDTTRDRILAAIDAYDKEHASP